MEIINLDQLRIIAGQRKLNIIMIEKDYLVTLLLYLIKDVPGIYFKGGTALNKLYLNHKRLSEDLDFSLTRNIKDVEGVEKKNRGLIWHWQGSGKTLTMIFSANKLYPIKELANPTIFFILDRTELEEQFYNEFNGLDLGVKVEKIDSIHKLKEVLMHDEGKGKRGLFTVLVHKFRENELKEADKILKELSKDNQTISNRKNIVAFIDESHRTQYGLLAAQMKYILKNAFFFAFTGTPISKKTQNTHLEFAYPQFGENYLDKYFIKDAINDGFTLKIVYQPRLEKEVHLKKDQLDLLLKIEDEDLPEKKRKEYEEKVKKKINIRKAYYKNRERVAKIAKDISQHFKENLDNKYKAMV